MKYRIFSLILFSQLAIAAVFAQTTEFTYQGSLKDGAATATGTYDFEFRVYDLAAGGSQIGSTNGRSGVSVSAGIFAVNLDFGSGFPGADRYLEIAVRPSGGGGFTILSPRQKIASAPYAIKSLNSSTADTASTAVSATNAATAVSFTGALNGDVTGTQSATTVARLQNRNVANTAPTDGQVLKYNAANNRWQPDTDNTGSGGGGGTITGVTAGTGLTGGGTTGTVAVSIANGGVGTTQLADGNVTDAKIVSVSGAKVGGAVANATNAATAANSTQLGGIAANQYVQTNDSRLSDARSPTAGSTNYIQNSVAAQAAANFNISGTGTASILNAAQQFNLNGSRILTATGSGVSYLTAVGYGTASNNSGVRNSFFGTNAGIFNSSGSQNSFFGSTAGASNTTGGANSFFGAFAGEANGSGNSNSIFGAEAGRNATGSDNSFFGNFAGAPSTGSQNSFFGSLAGGHNTSGTRNAFFGYLAGNANTTGDTNAFFGSEAGAENTIGARNSFFGVAAGKNNIDGTTNSFFGRVAGFGNSSGGNNVFVGDSAGYGNLSGSRNSYIGANAGLSNSSGDNNVAVGYSAGSSNSTGFRNTFVGSTAGNTNTSGSNNTIIGYNADLLAGSLSYATAIGSDAVASASNSIYMGRSDGSDTVRIPGNTRITGNLGIGLPNPLVKLQVDGGTDAAPGSGGYIVAGATTGLNVVIDNNEIMARSAGATATLALNASGGDVNLIQAGTGNVGIGTSAPGDKLDVDGDIRVGTSGTNGCLKNNNGGTITGTCSSDIRFKRGIKPFSSMLDKVAGLRPVSYYWRPAEFPGKGFGNAMDFGLIAQEVQQIMPELVSEDSHGFKQIDYSRLPLITIQAVKELNSLVSSQNAQIQKQQSEIELLKRLVCRSNRRSQVCRQKHLQN